MTKGEAKRFIEAFVKLRDIATDEMALQVVELYPDWKEGTYYTVGQKIVFDGELYRVLQDHTAQLAWAAEGEDEPLYEKIVVANVND